MDQAQRVLRGRLIATLATKLTELDVDFRGIIVLLDEGLGVWEVRVEFDPMIENRLEYYQQMITTESLKLDFEIIVQSLARMIGRYRQKWLKTAK